jgi:hypothetical protein
MAEIMQDVIVDLETPILTIMNNGEIKNISKAFIVIPDKFVVHTTRGSFVGKQAIKRVRKLFETESLKGLKLKGFTVSPYSNRRGNRRKCFIPKCLDMSVIKIKLS